jgi:hypothetical protein
MSRTKIANKPLPDDLRPVLHAYQQNTNLVIRWLKKTTNTFPVNNKASGPEVLEKAKIVLRLNVRLTQQLRIAFETARSGRREVNRWYVSEDLAKRGRKSTCTEDHEFYLGKLDEAYCLLFPPTRQVEVFGLRRRRLLLARGLLYVTRKLKKGAKQTYPSFHGETVVLGAGLR